MIVPGGVGTSFALACARVRAREALQRTKASPAPTPGPNRHDDREGVGYRR
jgi:hypothetical protein